MIVAVVFYVLLWVGLCVSVARYAAQRPFKARHDVSDTDTPGKG